MHLYALCMNYTVQSMVAINNPLHMSHFNSYLSVILIHYVNAQYYVLQDPSLCIVKVFGSLGYLSIVVCCWQTLQVIRSQYMIILMSFSMCVAGTVHTVCTHAACSQPIGFVWWIARGLPRQTPKPCQCPGK